MSRAGLSPDRVVEAAVELVAREGLGALGISALASALGVKPPSLYKHVGGLDALRTAVVAHAAGQLAAAMAQAAVGRSRDDAVRRLADTWRAWGRQHPHLHAALPVAFQGQPPAVVQAGERMLAVLGAVFEGYGLRGDAQVHAIRAFRAAVDGFVRLEASGGFALDVDPDASFVFLVETLLAGLRARA